MKKILTLYLAAFLPCFVFGELEADGWLFIEAEGLPDLTTWIKITDDKVLRGFPFQRTVPLTGMTTDDLAAQLVEDYSEIIPSLTVKVRYLSPVEVEEKFRQGIFPVAVLGEVHNSGYHWTPLEGDYISQGFTLWQVWEAVGLSRFYRNRIILIRGDSRDQTIIEARPPQNDSEEEALKERLDAIPLKPEDIVYFQGITGC